MIVIISGIICLIIIVISLWGIIFGNADKMIKLVGVGVAVFVTGIVIEVIKYIVITMLGGGI